MHPEFPRNLTMSPTGIATATVIDFKDCSRMGRLVLAAANGSMLKGLRRSSAAGSPSFSQHMSVSAVYHGNRFNSARSGVRFS
jgi:hypothetical protein